MGEIEALELGEVVGRDDVAAVEAEIAGRGEEAGATVAEGVEVLVDGDVLEELSIRAKLLGVEAVVGVDAGDGGEMGLCLGWRCSSATTGVGWVR